MLAQDRGGCCCDAESSRIYDCYAYDRGVARIRGRDKRSRHGTPDNTDSQTAMCQRLIMNCHRFAIDRNVHRLGQLQWGQLPQPAEQPLGRAPRQHDPPRLLDPHGCTLDQR